MKVFGILVAALISSAIYSFLAGFSFMLAVGVIHAEWIPACPTIGYWWAVVVCALIRAALQVVDTSSESS